MLRPLPFGEAAFFTYAGRFRVRGSGFRFGVRGSGFRFRFRVQVPVQSSGFESTTEPGTRTLN
jgi:hypothetical protein